MELTHQALCDIAVKWLKRPNSSGGHGCHIAISEIKSGNNGEIPDAIGFRSTDYPVGDGSILVEVKVNRSDFLADKNKPHRIAGGIGNWRYFMAPTGLIKIDELPNKWGLIEVNNRGHCSVIAGPAAFLGRGHNWVKYHEILAEFQHETNTRREQFILVKLLSRIGNVEQMNKKFKEIHAENSRLIDKCFKLEDTLRIERNISTAFKRKIHLLESTTSHQ